MKPSDIAELPDRVRRLKKLQFQNEVYTTPAQVRSETGCIRVKQGDVLSIVRAFPELPIQVKSWKISGMRWLTLLASLADRGIAIEVCIFLRIRSDTHQQIVMNYSKDPASLDRLIKSIENAKRR
jgi:hypothetical protein